MLDKYYHTKDVYYTREKMTAYLRGELKDYEVRAFEKLMAEDPLLQEALEGIKQSGWAAVEKRLQHLDKKTDILTGVKKPFVLSPVARNISVAAMLLVLIGTSYLIVNQLASTTPEQSAMELQQPDNTTTPTPGNIGPSDTMQNQNLSETDRDEGIKTTENEMKKTAAAADKQEDMSEPAPVMEDVILDLAEETVSFDLADDAEIAFTPAAPVQVDTYVTPANVKESRNATSESESTTVYLSGTPAKAETLNETYAVVEEMPQFPGGDKALQEYLVKNIRYPAIAKDNNMEGIVYVQFVIDETGDIINTKVVKGIGGGCDEEALRVVNNMPLWIPGKQGGYKVKVLYTLPIKFSLD